MATRNGSATPARPQAQPRLFLMRHCRTQWNDERRVQGSRDIPLSPEGVAEAQALAPTLAELGIQRIMSSSLTRAVQTARIYAEHLGVPLGIDARLREIDHGDWEGEYRDRMAPETKATWDAWRSDPARYAIPGGSETAPEAQARIVCAVREALAQHSDETILVVTHMHIRATLLCALNGVDLTHFHEQTARETAPLAVAAEQIARLAAFAPAGAGTSRTYYG